MPSRLAAGQQERRRNASRKHLHLAGKVLFCIQLVCGWQCPNTSAETSLEFQVKAAFLFNFTKFVQWPVSAFSDANSPFVICIIGNDPFGRALDDIVEGESVNGHKIDVQRITDTPQSCHVLYGAENVMPPWSTAPAAGILTVGERESILAHGAVIGFVLDNGRVRFDISLKAAARQGLKLSSKLLSVARSVEK